MESNKLHLHWGLGNRTSTDTDTQCTNILRLDTSAIHFNYFLN